MIKNFKKKKNNKGFTLVELLVVIAIIGLLAVVAVPTLFGQIDKARVADVNSNVSSIKNAAMAYYADNGTMPTLVANGASNTDLVKAKYLDSTPDKDSLKYEVTVATAKQDAAADKIAIAVGDCVLTVTGIKANNADTVKAELVKAYGTASAIDDITKGGKVTLTYVLIKK